MIVSGQPTAAAIKLADRLTDPGEGKRVQILELPYEASLHELLFDWQVISEGTLGAKGLYHARVCPAPGTVMTPAQWQRGADILGEELGLQQPHHRALVLHDDGERPYLNVVWQRTNIDTWTLSKTGHTYRKHERASRRMEQEFGHPAVREKRARGAARYPEVLPGVSAPPFNRDEGQQAKRTGIQITAMKAQIAALKAAAESPEKFKIALENAGYLLARGNSGYVLVDRFGSVYSLAGQLRTKVARVNEFMAPIALDGLPTVADAKNRQYQISRRQDAPASET